MNKILLVFTAILLIGAEYPTETEWQNDPTNWSRYVESIDDVEVRLSDGSRVDYLGPRDAIEIDWARKWAEGIGQAVFYAEMTDRRATLILLVRDWDRELKYVNRCLLAATDLDVRVVLEFVEPEENHDDAE